MPELKAVAINTTIILMFLNAGPGMLVASGVANDMGITPAVSGDQAIGDANTAMQNVEVSGGFASTLFAVYTSVTGPVRAVMGILFGGPIMLISAGVPGWLVDFMFAPQYVIVGGTIIFVLSGRRL